MSAVLGWSVTEGTYGGPDNHAAGHFGDALVGHLEDDGVLLDLLDHGLGHDVNLRRLEGRLGVVDQLLAEHGQHGGKRLDKRDLDRVGELGVPRAQVVLEEVVELTAARWSDLLGCVTCSLLTSTRHLWGHHRRQPVYMRSKRGLQVLILNQRTMCKRRSTSSLLWPGKAADSMPGARINADSQLENQGQTHSPRSGAASSQHRRAPS